MYLVCLFFGYLLLLIGNQLKSQSSLLLTLIIKLLQNMVSGNLTVISGNTTTDFIHAPSIELDTDKLPYILFIVTSYFLFSQSCWVQWCVNYQCRKQQSTCICFCCRHKTFLWTSDSWYAMTVYFPDHNARVTVTRHFCHLPFYAWTHRDIDWEITWTQVQC